MRLLETAIDQGLSGIDVGLSWPSGRSAPAYFYGKNAFIIFVNGGELTSSAEGQRPQVLFRAGGEKLAEGSTKGNVRGIIIELK